MNEMAASIGNASRSSRLKFRGASLVGVVVLVTASLSVACTSTLEPTEDGAKVTGNTMFTFSGVADGRSKHYVMSQQGTLVPQGGDPRQDADIPDSPSASASPSTPTRSPTSATQADQSTIEPELRGDSTPDGVQADSGGKVEWKVLSAEHRARVPQSFLVLYRVLEDSSDSERLGFSYGMMETGVLVVAVPEGVLLSWDKERYKGKVSISKNGSEIARVPVKVGSYLDRDVTKLNEYSYNIYRTKKKSGGWSSMSLDVGIPPAFDRKTLENMVYLQASAFID